MIDREVRSDAVISDHVVYAMAAALIPVPIVDIGAVAAVQLDMIKGLAKCYDVPYEQDRSKAIVASLAGGALPRLGASAFKVLPGVGSIVGGMAQVILSGASTYAIGNVFRTHFDRDGTFRDLDADALMELYRQYFEKGREVAESLRRLLEPRDDAGSADDVARSLERLGRLRETGAITAEEFDTLKRTTLAKLESHESHPRS